LARRLAAVLAILAIALPLAAVPTHAATIILVPHDFATIQAAVDAAANGDTIRVSPGTYVETVDFRGKAVTLESSTGRDATIIDGGRRGSVVTMLVAPGLSQVLRGFTVRGGYSGGFGGGGVQTTGGGSALIEDNLVSGNLGCPGAGITAQFSAATIQRNIISNNHPNCSGSPGGGGVEIGGAGTVRLVNNLITGNAAPSGSGGGGISLFAAGTPTITGNVITNNVGESQGGAISISNSSDAVITNNLMVGNRADVGGGVYWLVLFGATGPNLTNNTIAFNSAVAGTAVFADGFDGASRIVNNVLVGSGSQAVLECRVFIGAGPVPMIRFNDVLNTSGGGGYGGDCSDQTGLNGNIAADPLFLNVAEGDFHLRPGSPAVDAGTNDGAPTFDIEGNPRPLDGSGRGVAIADMGAYELVPVGPVLHSLALNGTTAFAEAPDAAKLNLTGDWTVETWFKDETAGGYNHPFAKLVSKADRNLSPEVTYMIVIGNNVLRAGVQHDNVSIYAEADLSATTANAWHHVAAAFTRSTQHIVVFLDGVQVAEQTLGVLSDGNTVPVGMGRGGTGGYYFTGKLDDVRIWNTARTGAEVAANMAAEFSSAPAGLIANWKFDEASGTTAADSTAAPDNATLNGGATFSTDVHP
jgi:hypothetical protein